MSDKVLCNICNKEMQEGYSICDGLQYYCSDKCLETEMSIDEYIQLYEEGYAFWSTFDE